MKNDRVAPAPASATASESFDEEAFDSFEAQIEDDNAADSAEGEGEDRYDVDDAGVDGEDDTKPVRRTGAGARFVDVPAEAIHAAFRAAGFTEDAFGGEIMYVRTHSRCKHLSVQVYTSLPVRGGDARGLGEDAVRVTAIFKKARRGAIHPDAKPFVRVAYKGKRVFRTAPQGMPENQRVAHVIARMLERAREAYAACNEFAKADATRCYECGSAGHARPQGQHTQAASPAAEAMVAVEGNTYPVKDALRALGGRWDAAAKVWRVPASRGDEAAALVAGGGPR